MTQISGKLYQMKNAARTENRYPMTVIEGVYGLATYLQQQFGSLADIYMPIEGIHEAKTGQEFVYRQTPNTIGANLLNIDRINGKSLVWNQLVQNGNFADGTTGWTANYGTLSSSDGILTKTVTGGVTYSHNLLTTSISSVAGHKYLLLFSVKHTHSSNLYFRGFYGVNSDTDELVEPNVWKRCCLFINPIGADISSQIQIFSLAQNVEYTEYYKNIQCIDLTLLYGSEISGMTDAQILAKFESEYPGYHDHDEGTLISNDAQSIVTVGRNQWDEEWELASIDWGTLKIIPDPSGGRFAPKNFIPVFAGATYYLNAPDTASSCIVLAYTDEDSNGINCPIVSELFTIPAGCRYIKFGIIASEYGTTYNHDICINISDASFNGQYEPYWKNTLELNIKTLTGKKDGQGASVTIFPEGAGGVGSVYDELRKSVAYKRFGIVDLGTLTWTYQETVIGGSSVAGFTAYFSCGQKINSDSVIPNASCARYILRSPDQLYLGMDKAISYRSSSIYVADSGAGTDAAAFKAAMNGVMLIYQLNTPETYVLDTPLVTAMRAGTTEERISPNSDGLSAPFCGDLTYSVSAASDALDAQYATAAGRLYNKRKIWGNDFDGTQDVTGLATLGEGAKVSKVFTLPTTPPPAGSVASGEYALYVDPNGNYSQ